MFYADDFETLLIDDRMWWLRLVEGLRLLADNDPSRPTLWPVDDFIATKKFVSCPRRGTHLRLVECWMCWCDVAWAVISTEEALLPGHESL